MRRTFSSPGASLSDKFWARADKTGDCWTWMPKTGHQGKRRNQRYGHFHLGGNRYVRAHRFAYELSHGPIPDGLVVRHTCDNQSCVNPAHLLIGTHADNTADAVERNRFRSFNTGKTHCKHGHVFSGWNLMVNKKGYRQCRTCTYDRINRRRAALRAGKL